MMPLICFVASHGASAAHFAVFADDLEAKGCKVEIFAAGPAKERLGVRAHPFSLNGRIEIEVAEEIAQECSEAALVITDVGHPFNIALQQALSQKAPQSLRAAYYDNPEDFVPGGYSETAAKVMLAAQRVFFANANLADAPIYQAPSLEVDLGAEKKVGLGYYPLEGAAAVAAQRKEKGKESRARLFQDLGVVDRGQRVLVYAGGNNEEYFSKAWPAFLDFLKDAASQGGLSDALVVLQQHPEAKRENRDRKELEEFARKFPMPPVYVSTLNSCDAQAAADAMLYYQTSMAAQFVLAEIPTIQVGHLVYRDALTKSGLCKTATNAKELLLALKEIENLAPADSERVKENLGIRSDWASRLMNSIPVPPHGHPI